MLTVHAEALGGRVVAESHGEPSVGTGALLDLPVLLFEPVQAVEFHEVRGVRLVQLQQPV